MQGVKLKILGLGCRAISVFDTGINRLRNAGEHHERMNPVFAF